MPKDPKQSDADKKPQLQLIPTVAMKSMAGALSCGAHKKGRGEYNWRYSEGVKSMTYVGAIRRHIDEYIDGVAIDPDSGESPLGHIMATCAILLDAEKAGKLIDDRPRMSSRKHVLFEAHDTDLPESITDRNGDLVLCMCGKAEIDLEGPCTGRATICQ